MSTSITRGALSQAHCVSQNATVDANAADIKRMTIVAYDVDGTVLYDPAKIPVGVVTSEGNVGDTISITKDNAVRPIKMAVAVSAGDPIGSDANGQGIIAGSGTYAIGVAQEAGLAGSEVAVDIGKFLVA